MSDPPYETGMKPEGVETAVIIIKARSAQGNGTLRYEVPANQSILSAISSIAMQTKQPLVAVVNGVTMDMTYVLQPGDTVQCFPQIAGG